MAAAHIHSPPKGGPVMTELISRMNEAMPLGYQLAFLIRVLVATLCGGAIGAPSA